MNKNQISDYAFQIENVEYELEEIELFMEHGSFPVALMMYQEFAQRYHRGLLYAEKWYQNHKIESSA
jgi:hypothetical protein